MIISDQFLEEYIKKELIRKERIGFDQIEKTLRRAEKDIKASERNLQIDEGFAYEMAYTAMLHAARAFLFVKGYRPTSNYQHRTVVNFVSHFLGDKYKILMQKFDRMRKTRNIFIYEPWKSNISEDDAKNALKTAAGFIEIIKAEIIKENPQAHFEF
jgi:uncharacterized protein (UPF0332 family)